MLELRFHGRGGQGVVVGTTILGETFFSIGKNVQFFPEFGTERRGSPVQAFLRVADERIRCRYGIYEPDHVILFDTSILKTVDITSGLKENGRILINSKKAPEEFGFRGKWRTATIDADGISLKYGLGSEAAPIINAAMTGAFAGLIGMIPAEALAEAVRRSVPVKHEQNAAAALEAFNEAKKMRRESEGFGKKDSIHRRERLAYAACNLGQHAL